MTILLEGALYDDITKDAFLNDDNAIANGFFFNFIGTIAMYQSAVKKEKILQYIKNDGKLQLQNITDDNNDMSLIVKIMHDKGYFKNPAVAKELTRFIAKLRTGTVDSVDPTIVQSWIEEVKPTVLKQMSKQLIRLKDDFMITGDFNFLSERLKYQSKVLGHAGDYLEELRAIRIVRPTRNTIVKPGQDAVDVTPVADVSPAVDVTPVADVTPVKTKKKKSIKSMLNDDSFTGYTIAKSDEFELTSSDVARLALVKNSDAKVWDAYDKLMEVINIDPNIEVANQLLYNTIETMPDNLPLYDFLNIIIRLHDNAGPKAIEIINDATGPWVGYQIANFYVGNEFLQIERWCAIPKDSVWHPVHLEYHSILKNFDIYRFDYYANSGAFTNQEVAHLLSVIFPDIVDIDKMTISPLKAGSTTHSDVFNKYEKYGFKIENDLSLILSNSSSTYSSLQNRIMSSYLANADIDETLKKAWAIDEYTTFKNVRYMTGADYVEPVEKLIELDKGIAKLYKTRTDKKLDIAAIAYALNSIFKEKSLSEFAIKGVDTILDGYLGWWDGAVGSINPRYEALRVFMDNGIDLLNEMIDSGSAAGITFDSLMGEMFPSESPAKFMKKNPFSFEWNSATAELLKRTDEYLEKLYQFIFSPGSKYSEKALEVRIPGLEAQYDYYIAPYLPKGSKYSVEFTRALLSNEDANATFLEDGRAELDSSVNRELLIAKADNNTLNMWGRILRNADTLNDAMVETIKGKYEKKDIFKKFEESRFFEYTPKDISRFASAFIETEEDIEYVIANWSTDIGSDPITSLLYASDHPLITKYAEKIFDNIWNRTMLNEPAINAAVANGNVPVDKVMEIVELGLELYSNSDLDWKKLNKDQLNYLYRLKLDDKFKDAVLLKLENHGPRKRYLSKYVEFEVGLQSIIDDIESSPIPFFEEIDPQRMKRLLEINKLDKDMPTLSKEDTVSMEAFNRFINHAQSNFSLKPVEQHLVPIEETQEEKDRKSALMHQTLRANVHGRNGMRFIESFDVNIPLQHEKSAEFLNTVGEGDGIIIPMFHGCSAAAATMILRYGFTIVPAGDQSVTGAYLGEGIYGAPNIDKSQQYVGEAYTHGGRVGTEGYLFEMKAILGENLVNYQSAGHGNDSIRSSEYCMRDGNAQCVITRAHRVVIVREYEIEELAQQYPQPLGENMNFKTFISESKRPHVSTYTFTNGRIPVSISRDVPVKKFQTRAHNIMLEPSQYGMSVVITGTKESNDFVFTSASEFKSTNPELFQEFINFVS